MTEALPADVLEALTKVAGRVVDVQRLEGGLRNRTFRVRTADGADLAVRLACGESAQSDREAELANAAAAAEAGVAPAVKRMPFDSLVLVTDFIDGAALLPADLEDPAVLTRIARVVRELHGTRGFVGRFDLAASRRSYVAEVEVTGVQLPRWYGELVPAVEAMEAVLLAVDEPLVASHNDLVPANLIAEGERVWVIDFEYSAPNLASFDLGTLVAAGGLDRDAAGHLVSTYWGMPSIRRISQARAWALIQRVSYLPWARAQASEVRRDDPSHWADGGPAGLDDLHGALTGSRWADLQADLLTTD